MNMFEDMFFDTVNNQKINMDTNTNINLFNPYEAYMKGNLYKNLYNEYKDYKPTKLIPNNEEAELLLNLNQLSFENQDIRLYLDIFPTDRNMINKYNMNITNIKELITTYENKYGPLTCTSLSAPDIFSWEEYSFPWIEVNS